MKTQTNIFLMLLSIALLSTTSVVGCVEQDGPMEKAGESLDQAADDVSEGVENAGDEIEDATE